MDSVVGDLLRLAGKWSEATERSPERLTDLLTVEGLDSILAFDIANATRDGARNKNARAYVSGRLILDLAECQVELADFKLMQRMVRTLAPKPQKELKSKTSNKLTIILSTPGLLKAIANIPSAIAQPIESKATWTRNDHAKMQLAVAFDLIVETNLPMPRIAALKFRDFNLSTNGRGNLRLARDRHFLSAALTDRLRHLQARRPRPASPYLFPGQSRPTVHPRWLGTKVSQLVTPIFADALTADELRHIGPAILKASSATDDFLRRLRGTRQPRQRDRQLNTLSKAVAQRNVHNAVEARILKQLEPLAEGDSR